jgi:hypothetical protein
MVLLAGRTVDCKIQTFDGCADEASAVCDKVTGCKAFSVISPAFQHKVWAELSPNSLTNGTLNAWWSTWAKPQATAGKWEPCPKGHCGPPPPPPFVAMGANIVVANGNLQLSFSAAGELLTLTTHSATSSYSRDATGLAGRTTVLNSTEVSSAVTSNATSLCVHRVVKTGGQPLSIQDCYQPSAKAANAVQWTTSIHSDAASLWSTEIRRNLDFKNTLADEKLWIPADTTANGSSFLLATYPVSQVGAQTFWMGGLLTTPATACNKKGECKGAYQFKGPIFSVPVIATLAEVHDSGILMALDLDDFLSTQLSLTTAVLGSQHGWGFGYEQYRLGGGSARLVLRADIAAIPADARAVAGFVTARHPTFFKPAVPAATTLASGTAWYSKCGPAVGGCDLIDSNESSKFDSFASELSEIAFKWVSFRPSPLYTILLVRPRLLEEDIDKDAFAVSFRYGTTTLLNISWATVRSYSPSCLHVGCSADSSGLCTTDIPPVTNSSEIYVSDAGVPISVDLLRARFRGYKVCDTTTSLHCLSIGRLSMSKAE